jgi:hypothetical protein
MDSANADAEKLLLQVKNRIQEITGARSSGGGKCYHGTDSAVDKARAKLGIHNKSAEQVRSFHICLVRIIMFLIRIWLHLMQNYSCAKTLGA